MSPSINWRHDGRRILLPATILAPLPTHDLTGFEGVALVDTGSTTSGVTPRVVRQLDLFKLGKRPLGSAQGEGQAERYLFRIALRADRDPFDPPAFPFVFPEVVGFELTENFTFDALIGMDILKLCEFSMRADATCRISFG